jgi:hypothetical protein
MIAEFLAVIKKLVLFDSVMLSAAKHLSAASTSQRDVSLRST